jgi:uncharacterized heparinase superfamily protein
MSALSAVKRVARLVRKPPGYVIKRLAREGRMEADRYLAPLAARRMNGARLARLAGQPDIDHLWRHLAARPYPAVTHADQAAGFASLFPESVSRIEEAAQRALRHEVDLLGSGPVLLGERIDWLRDFKTGHDWPTGFCRAIDYVNKGRPSDVKMPWELSRLQWLLPAGQAYLLTGEERYAIAVRDVLEQWIAANPYAWSVNWSCTMEPALRILTWTWFFHVFARSQAWADEGFRDRFLTSLYLHGAFTLTHIERSSINGNHLTADAAGLVFAGLFFDGIGDARAWQEEGWRSLCREIELQVHSDGVDFEASSAYHRLVAELFVMPARYRLARRLDVDGAYRARLTAMARFACAYTRPDGSSPNWGDADDGRALPLGTQALSDHRYLAGLVGVTVDDADLSGLSGPPSDEVFWHCGRLPEPVADMAAQPGSQAFAEGGVYIIRDADNHLFIDCGPVGLAGLGGHGHNDALSFEAWLAGTPLIVDPGSFVYTASFEDRNAFRSTAFHNTPQIDGEEINRFYAPDNLWNLHEDARASCLTFETGSGSGRFVGRHAGYQRLASPVGVEREIAFDATTARLVVEDRLSGEGKHAVAIPLHFAPGVALTQERPGHWVAMAGDRRFSITFDADCAGEITCEPARVSPSYGVEHPAHRLVWRGDATLPMRLAVVVAPRLSMSSP